MPAAGTVSASQRSRPRPSRLIIIARLAKSSLLCLGLLFLLVTFTPLTRWWAHKLAGSFDDPKGEILIVLGASETQDGILGYSSYLRTEYAIRCWREGWPREILISGGAKNGAQLASAMRDLMVAYGVKAEVIHVETESTDTRENAINVAQILRNAPGPKVLLTSDYHMYRAQRAFEKAGLRVLPRPFPDVIKRSTAYRGRWTAFLDLCVESAKIAYYRIRGWA